MSEEQCLSDKSGLLLGTETPVMMPKDVYTFFPFRQSVLAASAGRASMCLHTGMTEAYVWDLDTAQERVAGVAETRQILGEVDEVFRRHIGHLLYSHKVYMPGAFCISGNDSCGMRTVFCNHYGC